MILDQAKAGDIFELNEFPGQYFRVVSVATEDEGGQAVRISKREAETERQRKQELERLSRLCWLAKYRTIRHKSEVTA